MRKYKRCLIAAIGLLTLTACTDNTAEAHTLDLFAMDTYMNLKVYGSHAEDALQAAEQRITELESMLSVTDEASEIWAVNHANGNPVTVSDDTFAILQTARQVSAESGGALSVSLYPVLQAWGFTTGFYQIPAEDTLHNLLQHVDDSRITINGHQLTLPEHMQLDLGALAKGYTGDAVMDAMRECGVTSAIISLGGNVQALGSKPDGSDWTVGIVNPFAPDTNLGVVTVADKAVITSGNYERYFIGDDGNRYWHILDPVDGYPADNGLISVTVIGESGVRCDALSTALFVEGEKKAVKHWQSSGDFEMVCVTDDGRLLVTEDAQFQPACNLPVTVISYE